MDPQKTLEKILDSLYYGNREDTIEALEDLAKWIKEGGFLPIVKSDWTLP